MINNKVIVGAMLVSQNVELLDITIPNLLKWCDWIVLVLDNESEEVERKVLEFQKQYHNKIWVRRSSIPHNVMIRGGRILDYRKRWKSCKGVIRHDVFNILKSILRLNQKGYNKIDILLFQDSDEIFTDYLPELLEQFIANDKQAISMKPIDVVGSMKTIRRESKGHHVFIMKYSEELAGLPRRFYAQYYPLSHNDLMFTEYYSVHLAYLTDGNRKWRAENWKRDMALDCDLWELDKSVEQMSPEEIKNILKNKADLNYA